VLRLGHNGFGDAQAAKALGQLLSNSESKLRSVYSAADAQPAKALGQLLSNPESKLRELDLSFNRVALVR
ncbi:hypothetical protein T484DRAFT_1812187, partial [Baffinella frigidus]